jgi:hypothetical protein
MQVNGQRGFVTPLAWIRAAFPSMDAAAHENLAALWSKQGDSAAMGLTWYPIADMPDELKTVACLALWNGRLRLGSWCKGSATVEQGWRDDNGRLLRDVTHWALVNRPAEMEQ